MKRIRYSFLQYTHPHQFCRRPYKTSRSKSYNFMQWSFDRVHFLQTLKCSDRLYLKINLLFNCNLFNSSWWKVEIILVYLYCRLTIDIWTPFYWCSVMSQGLYFTWHTIQCFSSNVCLGNSRSILPVICKFTFFR